MKQGRKDRIYKRSDSPVYYLDYSDPYTGRRIRRSSGKTTLEEAREELEIALHARKKDLRLLTLSDIMLPYEDPETNPRRKQARMDGTPYGEQHAKHFAYVVRKLRKEMQEICPRFLGLRIVRIRRADLKAIKELIVDDMGQTRSTQSMFQALKVMLSQCVEDGIIDSSPGTGIKDIHYKEKKRKCVILPRF